MKLPVDEDIIHAIANLIDDSQIDKRQPSHADLLFQIQKANLVEFDPNKPGMASLGKAKRVRSLLVSAFDSYPDRVEIFVSGILSSVRAFGGFIKDNPNYCGKDNISALAACFKRHGFLLDDDGRISALVLDNLSSIDFTDALNQYILRAKKGIEDAALLVGTGKDLMEATAAHIITERFGVYSNQSNFPTLLGQAFSALGLATPQSPITAGEHPRKAIERNMFELACSVNKLRNKQGTGHGRPFVFDLTMEEAKFSVETIGIVSEFLLKKLQVIERS